MRHNLERRQQTLLSEDSFIQPYAKLVRELLEEGYDIKAIRPKDPQNGIRVARKEGTHAHLQIGGMLADTSNMLLIAQNTLVANPLAKQVTVVGSNVSSDFAARSKYKYDFEKEGKTAAELHIEADDGQGLPAVLTGHSQGSIVLLYAVQELLDQYRQGRRGSIKEVVLVMPAAIEELSMAEFIRKALQLSSNAQQDVGALLPSELNRRHAEHVVQAILHNEAVYVQNAREEAQLPRPRAVRTGLSVQERLNLAYNQIILERTSQPDLSTQQLLSLIGEEQLEEYNILNRQITYLLNQENLSPKGQQLRDQAVRERQSKITQLLYDPISRRIAGNVYNEPTQRRFTSAEKKAAHRNKLSSMGQYLKNAEALSHNLIAAKLSEIGCILDQNPDLPPLFVTILGGRYDVFTGNLQLHNKKLAVRTSPKLQLNGFEIHKADHFTFATDAYAIEKLRQIAEQYRN